MGASPATSSGVCRTTSPLNARRCIRHLRNAGQLVTLFEACPVFISITVYVLADPVSAGPFASKASCPAVAYRPRSDLIPAAATVAGWVIFLPPGSACSSTAHDFCQLAAKQACDATKHARKRRRDNGSQPDTEQT